jgi:hypothetical protein
MNYLHNRVPSQVREKDMKRYLTGIWIMLSILTVFKGLSSAHGVVGKRFIPSTVTLEDPFPSDEMDLLKVTRGSKNDEGRETAIGFEFSKRLSPDFALGVEWEYLFVEPRAAGESRTSGAGNPEFSAKYALFRSVEHEGILSVGFGVEPGGVGPRRVAERVTTLTPSLFFGKGFGDLPDSLNYLQPLAITGAFGVNFPTRRRTVTTVIEDGEPEQEVERHPTTIAYGLAVMYSVPYLQSFVRDVGLGAPFDRIFPVVELNFETNASKPDRGHTTAFLNPGIVWAGKYVQLGMEAQVPLNSSSGTNVGVKALIHLFIDDLWPSLFTWTAWGAIGPTQK